MKPCYIENIFCRSPGSLLLWGYTDIVMSQMCEQAITVARSNWMKFRLTQWASEVSREIQISEEL